MVCSKHLTSSDGTTIYAEAHGDASKPAIVFIHGFSLSTRVWADLFKDPSLAENFYLVAYDLRAHGRSGKPLISEAYESKLFGDDFQAVLDAFNIKKPIVVGWSLGGFVITDILANLPEDTISGAIYIASAPGKNGSYAPYMRAEFASLSMNLFSADSETNRQARVQFVDECFNKPGPSQVKKWEWVGMGCMLPLATLSLLGTRTNDDTKLFEAARNGLPTLYLHGTADKTIDTIGIESLYNEFTALDIHRIQGGSHAIVADESVPEVAGVVEKFAKKVLSC